MRKTSRSLPASILGLALSLGLAAAGAAGAGELAGVTLPDTAKAGETSLVLNGMGLRTKYFAKVYVAGLYLEAKQNDPAKILAADTARRLEMQFLRSVDKGKIADAWGECLEGNSPGAAVDVQQAFQQLEGWTADMETGHKMTFTYQPGKGTEVAVQGAVKGNVAGKPFADAIFACWLGPAPPNPELKTGLLGQ